MLAAGAKMRERYGGEENILPENGFVGDAEREAVRAPVGLGRRLGHARHVAPGRHLPVSSCPMHQIGDPIPDVRVWVTTRERVPLRDLTERRPLLILTFLFAWSGT
jgi:hypothetical protein